MNSKTRLWTFTVAIAGFLFGFDTVVISGANLPIKELWQLSPLFHGTFIMSMALWGTVIGALFGGLPSEKFGRKPTLFVIGLLFLISAIGSALAPEPISFSIFRFVGGLAIGASSVAAPAFIAEISDSNKRGRLVAQYQFNIVLGILVAFISNFLLKGVGGEHDWRWMLGMGAIPAIIYCVLVLGIPESPRWLVSKKGNNEKALEILNQMMSPKAAKDELASYHQHSDQKNSVGLFTETYRKPLTLAFLLAFFNQWSGINFILYYAPEILERSGIGVRDSLLSSISIGVINLIFTMIGMILIDKSGRRQLLLWGSVGYIVSLFSVAFAFKTGASAEFLLVFLCLFIASHAIGQGAVIWVFIAEIFPNKVRSFGQAFGSGVHWVLAAFITLITPVFLDGEVGIFKDNPWPIFAFFGVMMVVQLYWVYYFVPETKTKSLEQLGENLE